MEANLELRLSLVSKELRDIIATAGKINNLAIQLDDSLTMMRISMIETRNFDMDYIVSVNKMLAQNVDTFAEQFLKLSSEEKLMPGIHYFLDARFKSDEKIKANVIDVIKGKIIKKEFIDILQRLYIGVAQSVMKNLDTVD